MMYWVIAQRLLIDSRMSVAGWNPGGRSMRRYCLKYNDLAMDDAVSFVPYDCGATQDANYRGLKNPFVARVLLPQPRQKTLPPPFPPIATFLLNIKIEIVRRQFP
jgi:hypothetical protein